MDACGLADTTCPRPPLLTHPLLPRMSPLRLPLVPSAPGDARCRERARGRGRGPPLSPPAIAHLELKARATCRMRRRKRKIHPRFLGRILNKLPPGLYSIPPGSTHFEDSPPRTQGSVGSALFSFFCFTNIPGKFQKKKPAILISSHIFLFSM